MTVENAKLVDVIGIDNTEGHVILTISDHLDWQDGATHVLALQDKLNSYVAFVESGELLEQYPNGKGRLVRIDVVLKHPPSSDGKRFFQKAQKFVEAAGVALDYRVLKDGE